ncbi:hypothetical protein NCAS_0A05040 [Naumovozyma castellii]|uniref:CENP-C homolog n=1 Tax=Naumovozyma castellii TaxID=27288 RepID=G0V6G9_NAUCA|nr:hypothetical protein NCAS_0A05040 [Naumovozyma castellii CBS 4309]CCC67062.1 hypothetical protein NCAS_0A05040 [Naumovozyma castellii CBS 4309]
MDYMNLGIRSRKTGLNVRDDIKKDEFSMENIDDFFKDDDTNMITKRRKSSGRRTSSLLPVEDAKHMLPLSLLEQSPDLSGQLNVKDTVKRTSVLSQASNLQSPFQPSNDELAAIPEEDEVPEEGHRSRYLSSRFSRTAPRISKARYSTQYDLNVSSNNNEKSLINEKSYNNNDYLQDEIPDLIEDYETTMDNTFNTSENALLEDEIESDEDRSYAESEPSIDEEYKEESNQDDDSLSDDLNLGLERRMRYESEESAMEDEEANESIERQAFEVINDDSMIGPDGIRRSTRVKIPTLEYWRNEKVVYKRKSAKPVLEIAKIITFDESENEFEQRKAKKRKTKRRQAKQKTLTEQTLDEAVEEKKNISANTDIFSKIRSGALMEADWLQDGILQANVNIAKDKEGTETIAFGPNMSEMQSTKDTKNEKFTLEIMFDKHREHFASGKLKLPKGGNKKLGDSLHTFMTFYVIQGITEVTISKTKFVATTGSTFQIPSFNKYSFKNIGNNQAKMFFVQVSIEGSSQTKASSVDGSFLKGDVSNGNST